IPAMALPALTLAPISMMGVNMRAMNNRTLTIGTVEPRFAARRSLQLEIGPTIIAAFAKEAETNTNPRAAMSDLREKRPTDARCGARQTSKPGTAATTPILSCGQARTQSRQNVQSKLPDLRGR